MNFIFSFFQECGRAKARPEPSGAKPCIRHAALRACAAPPPRPANGKGERMMRVHVPHSDLLAQTATTTEAPKKQKGIRHLQIGSTRIEFAHDMTQSFLWSGLFLSLAIGKIIRVGKSAWQDEPNYKHIARNEAEETELREFCCEDCGYTMFPARGREGKFFPSNFKCPDHNSCSVYLIRRQRNGAKRVQII